MNTYPTRVELLKIIKSHTVQWRTTCLQNKKRKVRFLDGSFTGLSSNGRTLGFEPNYLGPSPSDPIMEDGWKTPVWDDTLVTVPKRFLQEVALALSASRGLIQRLESHGESCCTLDARDQRALDWGREVLVSLDKILKDLYGKGQ